jgi:hypothetical protein
MESLGHSSHPDEHTPSAGMLTLCNAMKVLCHQAEKCRGEWIRDGQILNVSLIYRFPVDLACCHDTYCKRTKQMSLMRMTV